MLMHHSYCVLLTTDSVNITLVFDEPFDSTAAAVATRYSISDGIGKTPQTVTVIAPAFDKVSLKLTTALLRNKIYTVTVTAVTDRKGNSIGK